MGLLEGKGKGGPNSAVLDWPLLGTAAGIGWGGYGPRSGLLIGFLHMYKATRDVSIVDQGARDGFQHIIRQKSGVAYDIARSLITASHTKICAQRRPSAVVQHAQRRKHT